MTICPRRAAAALALLLSLCLALPPAMAEEAPPPGPAPEASGPSGSFGPPQAVRDRAIADTRRRDVYFFNM